MAMSEDVGSMALNSAQKAAELSVELLKFLMPQVQKFLKWTHETGPEIKLNRKGDISLARLISEAGKTGSVIQSNSNILSEDANKFVEKAKKYGIPVSITGEGEKVTLNYLERDTAAIKQIETEILSERLKERPQDYKHFKINESNITAMKAAFAENGVECQFVRGSNGETYCTFPAKDTEKAELIKQDFKAARNDVAENIRAEPTKTGIGKIVDLKAGKILDLDQFGGSVKKYQIVNLLQKELGYSPAKADLAANKLCDDLKLDPKEYLSHNRQLDNINSLKTNIRYESDSILLRNVAFSEVNFKDGEHTHISVVYGGKSAIFTPDTMSVEEMKQICVSELGMKEKMADETVNKTAKINTQINSKYKEIKVDRTGAAQTMEIERTSNNSFSVKLGSISKSYDLKSDKLAEKISREFGFSTAKAQTIIDKANNQSAFQNNIAAAAKKAAQKSKDTLSRGIENITKKGAR